MPVVINDKVEIRLMMPMSPSYDHRLVDGATAARFLNEVMNPQNAQPPVARPLSRPTRCPRRPPQRSPAVEKQRDGGGVNGFQIPLNSRPPWHNMGDEGPCSAGLKLARSHSEIQCLRSPARDSRWRATIRIELIRPCGNATRNSCSQKRAKQPLHSVASVLCSRARRDR